LILFFRIRIEFKKISSASQRKNAAYGGGKSNAGSNIHKPALQRFGSDMRENAISRTSESHLKNPSCFIGVEVLTKFEHRGVQLFLSGAL